MRVNLWHRLQRFERNELTLLLIGFGSCLLLLAFFVLAGQVMEGDTLAFDTRILRALRSPDNPAKPIGPAWVENVLLDLTALGGSTILTLVVGAIVGFLVLQGRRRTALFIGITAASGEVLNAVMKRAFSRPRPSIVPHLRDAVSSSFPSGHAMESAIIYLTLGAMLMRIADGQVTKIYCFSMALLLTFLVGASRVYLGVHYPTDVIGGWAIGMFWASVCWLVERRLDVRAGIKAERHRRD